VDRSRGTDCRRMLWPGTRAHRSPDRFAV